MAHATAGWLEDTSNWRALQHLKFNVSKILGWSCHPFPASQTSFRFGILFFVFCFASCFNGMALLSSARICSLRTLLSFSLSPHSRLPPGSLFPPAPPLQCFPHSPPSVGSSHVSAFCLPILYFQTYAPQISPNHTTDLLKNLYSLPFAYPPKYIHPRHWSLPNALAISHPQTPSHHVSHA